MSISNCPICGNAPVVYEYENGYAISCAGVESNVVTHIDDGVVVSYNHAISAIETMKPR